MAETAGHWGPWGVYEPPESYTLAKWEQYLTELKQVEFKPGAVPTKEEMVRQAEKIIEILKR
jgi:hypothetical protein